VTCAGGDCVGLRFGRTGAAGGRASRRGRQEDEPGGAGPRGPPGARGGRGPLGRVATRTVRSPGRRAQAGGGRGARTNKPGSWNEGHNLGKRSFSGAQVTTEPVRVRDGRASDHGCRTGATTGGGEGRARKLRGRAPTAGGRRGSHAKRSSAPTVRTSARFQAARSHAGGGRPPRAPRVRHAPRPCSSSSLLTGQQWRAVAGRKGVGRAATCALTGPMFVRPKT